MVSRLPSAVCYPCRSISLKAVAAALQEGCIPDLRTNQAYEYVHTNWYLTAVCRSGHVGLGAEGSVPCAETLREQQTAAAAALQQGFSSCLSTNQQSLRVLFSHIISPRNYEDYGLLGLLTVI